MGVVQGERWAAAFQSLLHRKVACPVLAVNAVAEACGPLRGLGPSAQTPLSLSRHFLPRQRVLRFPPPSPLREHAIYKLLNRFIPRNLAFLNFSHNPWRGNVLLGPGWCQLVGSQHHRPERGEGQCKEWQGPSEFGE